MLLTHGITYDHHYFDFPGFDGRYSYARSANAEGFATLTIDRLGSGASSHPPGSSLGMNTHVWVAHQLVQKLRHGGMVSASGPITFDKVIQVGHSYGSGVTWIEASRFGDVDAIVVTGANHFLRMDTIAQVLTPSFIPAAADPKFAGRIADPSYVTTRSGTRYADFMAPGNVDPRVVAADEELKQTVTTTELAEIPFDIGYTLDIRVPVLIAQGDEDRLFCGAGVTCESERQLINAEAPHLGDPPCVDAYLHPGAGHDNVLMPNARDFFEALNSWAKRTVPPDGTVSHGCPRFDPDEFKSMDTGSPQEYPSDPAQELATTPPVVGGVLNHTGQASAEVLDGRVSDTVFPALP
nr:alpha/beta fold hydrolase [Haloechinothrix aidingensis]